MFYAAVLNGEVTEYPLTERAISLRHPNISFPRPFSPPNGYELVRDVAPPKTEYFQDLKEVFPVRKDGILRRHWDIVPASEHNLRLRTSKKEEQIREERNAKLQASDWTQTLDAPVDSAAWAVYRRGLRDLSTQAGFPWNVEWPVIPGSN